MPAGCGPGLFLSSFLKNKEETQIYNRFSFTYDAQYLLYIFMCMFIIECMGGCVKRKSDFLCKNCVFLL